VRALLVALALVTTSVADAAPPKRPVPAYDGRASKPTTAGDVARTTLRVLLFPIRIVVDYGVRWPLGKLITVTEQSRGVRATIEAVGGRGGWKQPHRRGLARVDQVKTALGTVCRGHQPAVPRHDDEVLGAGLAAHEADRPGRLTTRGRGRRRLPRTQCRNRGDQCYQYQESLHDPS